uniref:G protein gamma domain-containing protein n=1 Tax=Arion vulgaris TaxID=1028688 RepID=A0A0B7AH77_9EUPU
MPSSTSAREVEAVRRVKMELHSLQTHAALRRHKTSDTIKDLISFVNSKMKSDLLIYPDKINPFKPKKECTVL